MGFHDRPSNWYNMSVDERDEWTRQDSALGSEHRAAVDARQEAEDAHADALRARKRMRAAFEEEMEGVQGSLNVANARVEELQAREEALVVCLNEVSTWFMGYCSPEEKTHAATRFVVATLNRTLHQYCNRCHRYVGDVQAAADAAGGYCCGCATIMNPPDDVLKEQEGE